MTDIALATTDQWQLVREIRLRSLSTDPSAFGPTWEKESTYDPAAWKARLESATWYLALDDGNPVGVIAFRAEDDDDPADRELQAMWVTPESRKQHLAARLVEAVVSGAAADGAATVSLYVGPHNDTAIAVYEAAGFSDTGSRWEVDDDPRSAWIKMRRSVR